MKEKRANQNTKYGGVATKVIRLPESLATFLQQQDPSVIKELVSQIKDGQLNLTVSVTNNQGYDFKSMITEEIAPLLARLEAIENTRSEATDTANFMSALHQKVKEVAPIKLVQLAHMELPEAM